MLILPAHAAVARGQCAEPVRAVRGVARPLLIKPCAIDTLSTRTHYTINITIYVMIPYFLIFSKETQSTTLNPANLNQLGSNPL